MIGQIDVMIRHEEAWLLINVHATIIDDVKVVPMYAQGADVAMKIAA